MSRSGRERLEDIRAAIRRCEEYRAHLEAAEYGAMAYDAVLRNLAVIGEAVRVIPEGFKNTHPEIPWVSIAGLRNIVVHEYFRVDPDTIRDILDNYLPTLRDAIAVSGDSE